MVTETLGKVWRSQEASRAYKALLAARENPIMTIGGYVVADVLVDKARALEPQMSLDRWKGALRVLAKMGVWFPDDETGGRGILRLPISEEY